MSSTVVYNVNTSTYYGQMTVNYNISGKFTEKSWSGNYIYTIYLSVGNCEYSTTFRGDKITTALPKIIQNDELPISFEHLIPLQ